MRIEQTSKIIYEDLSFKINGICFEVQNQLGRFCNEKQYADAIEQLLKESKITYQREKILPVSFEGEQVGRNKVDFLVEDKIVIDVKAKRIITREDYYQMRRYLQALNKKLGIIVNFKDKYIKPRRIINSEGKI